MKMIVVGVMLVLAMIPVVYALSNPPLDIWGEVTINGQPASDGTEVVATIDGLSFSMADGTKEGLYGIQIPRDVAATSEKEGGTVGDIITLVVNGYGAEPTITFSEGLIINQDVTVSYTVTTSSTVTTSCVEDWDCDDWSRCKHGDQERTCKDSNRCGTSYNKPREERDCDEERSPTVDASSGTTDNEQQQSTSSLQQETPAQQSLTLENTIAPTGIAAKGKNQAFAFYPEQPSKLIGSFVSILVVFIGLGMYHITRKFR